MDFIDQAALTAQVASEITKAIHAGKHPYKGGNAARQGLDEAASLTTEEQIKLVKKLRKK